MVRSYERRGFQGGARNSNAFTRLKPPPASGEEVAASLRKQALDLVELGLSFAGPRGQVLADALELFRTFNPDLGEGIASRTLLSGRLKWPPSPYVGGFKPPTYCPSSWAQSSFPNGGLVVVPQQTSFDCSEATNIGRIRITDDPFFSNPVSWQNSGRLKAVEVLNTAPNTNPSWVYRVSHHYKRDTLPVGRAPRVSYPARGVQPIFKEVVAPLPAIVQAPLDAVAPGEVRPLRFSEVPKQRPLRRLSPIEQTQRGPVRLPDLNKQLFRDADGRAGPTITITPSGVSSRPGSTSFPKPPGKHVRERKVIVAVGGVVKTIVNVATEAQDFVRSLWQALPKEFRSRPPKGKRSVTLQAMMWDIYMHLGDVDIPQAIRNLIANEIQDRFYGKAGKAYRESARRLHAAGYYVRPVGFQSGDRYRPYGAYGAGQPDGFPDPVSGLLPRFSYNDLVRAYWR